MMRIANFTMSVVSSRTTTPPEPSMLFAFARVSKSIAMSHSSAFRTGQDEPPGTTAFSFLPPRTPPPTSLIMRIRLKPIGSS